MKRLLFIFLLCSTVFGSVQAQRLLKGQKGIQLTASAVDGFKLKNKDKQAFALGIAVSSYQQNGNRWVFGTEYLQKKHAYKETLIPTSQFTVEGGYYLNVFSSTNKTFLVSTGLSAMGGYETVNWGKKLLYDGATIENKDAFLYGGAISLEMEVFLSDKTALLFHARERILLGSTINKFHFQCGVGFKFIIN